MKLKRILSAVLALMFFGCAAHAEELLCVNTEAFAALLTQDGGEVIPPGMYERIFCVSPGEFYAAGNPSGEGMLYSLCDAEGNILSREPRAMFDASGDVILFRDGALYGAMDRSGEILVPAEYTQLATNRNGGYFALTTDPLDDQADEILCISERGEILQSGVYTAEGLKETVDGRMPFRSPDTEKCGYLNEEGSVAIDAQLSYAGEFENGMALAALDGLYGVLSPSGEWLIAPKYAYVEIGGSVILGLLGGEACIVWDRATCAELFRFEGENLNAALIGDRALIMDERSICLYNREGALLMEADRSATLTAGAGDQLILAEGDWGTACVSIIDADGRQLERRDQHLMPLDDERYAFLTMNVAAYNSQALGEIRYSCDYDSIRYGMLNAEGEEILPAEYLEILCVGKDRYLTAAYDGYRVVDGDGNLIWCRLDEAAR